MLQSRGAALASPTLQPLRQRVHRAARLRATRAWFVDEREWQRFVLVKVGFIESAQSALLPENLSTGFCGSLYYRGPEGSPVAE